MSIALTVYDPITNERLSFVEDRGNGQRLYENAAGVRVICLPEEVNRYPTAQRTAPKRAVRAYELPDEAWLYRRRGTLTVFPPSPLLAVMDDGSVVALEDDGQAPLKPIGEMTLEEFDAAFNKPIPKATKSGTLKPS